MNNILGESLLILGLILLNGFFASAEIAIISLRHSKTRELINKGDNRAKTVKYLQESPETFLATIQVGITLVSTFASAFGGARLVDELIPFMKNIPLEFISSHAEAVAFVVVVITIAYLSLVLGELVPKSLGLRFAEKIALVVSYPIKLLSRIFFIFVKFLTFSSNIILIPWKDRTNFSETKLSEDEIRYMLAEGRRSGTIEKREHEFLENVFDFGDLEVRKIMVPPNKITAFEISDSPQEMLKILLERNYSRVPVYEEQSDNILGILYTKDLLAKLAMKQKVDIRALVRPPLFIPETQRLHDVLQKFKREKMHMGIILDEHGGVAGMVTLEDILEELVGDIRDETDAVTSEIQLQPDGSWLVDASTPITDINRVTGAEFPENEEYNSLSGLILFLVRRFPRKNEKVKYGTWEIQVKEVTKTQIKVAKLKKLKK